MKVTEVTTDAHRREFIEFPKRLYRGDSNWVCPLDSETEAVFDPRRNAAFTHGEATRWILSGDDGKTIGRVAAFIDEIRSKANRQPTGGLGFFEVTESREAAFMLFDTVRDWLAARGIKALDGPINFGENDNYWGLLVDGFMQPGFGMPYNKQYYKEYFTAYGFRTYFEQYSYHKDVASVEVFPERFKKIAEWISKRPGYTYRHFVFSQSDRFAADMVEIYNATWAVFKEDFTPLDPARIQNTLNQAKAFIDPELVWFAYHNDRPVAFFVIFPDLNQILLHLKGKLDFLSIIKLLWLKKRKTMTRARALIIGISPKYQKSGIESAIFYNLRPVLYRKPWYKEMELSWAGDFNPKIIALYESVGGKRMKTHYTMRYLFDRNKPFKRAPIIGLAE